MYTVARNPPGRVFDDHKQRLVDLGVDLRIHNAVQTFLATIPACTSAEGGVGHTLNIFRPSGRRSRCRFHGQDMPIQYTAKHFRNISGCILDACNDGSMTSVAHGLHKRESRRFFLSSISYSLTFPSTNRPIFSRSSGIKFARSSSCFRRSFT